MFVKLMSVLLLLQMSCYFRPGNCGKVLVWPMEFSHWLNLKIILDELAQRGHEVTVLRPASSIFVDPQNSPTLKFETFPTSLSKDDLEKVFTRFVDVWIYEIPRDTCLSYSPLLQNMHNEYSDTYQSLCKDTVTNKQLMTKLQNSKFDVLFSDAVAPCGEPTTLAETRGKAEMWLIRSYWDLEFPHPTLPNVDYVGGLHCKPAKPLPKEMEDFVQSSGEHGVVVFSLGSMVGNMTEEKSNAIAWALAQIPQKVLWRFDGKTPDTLGPNTRVYKWLPQNDLLGHPKTKAFVTHGGANGLYEAIHFGIPIIGIPLFGEQHDNIAYIVAKGAAVALNIRTMSRSDLLNALEAVIDNPSYKENAMWLSTIHHDQPIKPLDRAIFWIEFVMRHKGAKHLRPLAYNLTWYQYHSLDVIGFLLACVAAMAFFTIKSCLFIYQKFAKMGKKMKNE
ncbi:UDP-glucuronosyltransferase 2B17-like isoform X3 [Peromyscus californicus insignis]|uniref:UDP-glucuronosyltransferase 2B17-like isoform X3 n=1 Tax=Peromyscus californicus insignis TaxID=564181 RepID=UPI0022A7B983|nr:UDP-glucuronosyltransferase 2B17-like isoform X3 [Peromyscus californicus insignis]